MAIWCYLKHKEIKVLYKEKNKKYYYITCVLLTISFLSICVCIYTKLNDESRKKLSQLVLDEKDETNFIRYCEELFQLPGGDERFVQQYNSTKRTGSMKQVRSVCENYARSSFKQR
jgi:hypothetical protein